MGAFSIPLWLMEAERQGNGRFCVKTLAGHAEWVRCVEPSIDGRWLLSCSSDQVRFPFPDLSDQQLTLLGIQSARIWDAQSGETKMDLRGHENVIETAAFAPAAAYAAIRELAGMVCASSTYLRVCDTKLTPS